jgi:Ca2+-binding RTX toxin-like protein
MPKPFGNISIKGTGGRDTIEVTTGGVLVNGVLKHYTAAQLEAGAIIDGGAGDDLITGAAGPDHLVGSIGSDTLIGGAGFDTLSGGDGNDTLIDAVDGATFDGGSGIDLLDLGATTRNVGIDLQGTGLIFLDIHLSRSPTEWGSGELPPEIAGRIVSVENLRTGSGDDMLIGNSSANILEGGAGHDSLAGRGGNDTLFGGDGDDQLMGEAGNDTLYGGLGLDVFWATAGNGHDVVMDYFAGDRINFSGVVKPTQWVLTNGGTSLVGYFEGGASSITIVGVTNINQVVIGGQIVGTVGDDTIVGSADFDEIWGFAGNDTLFGNGGQDTLYGGAGNDLLDGGTAWDSMFGGSGNDRYVIDHGSDVAIELIGEGDDWAMASDNYLLRAGSEIEFLSTTNAEGTSYIDLGGNEFDNSITGNAGTNWLSGGGGSDHLMGLEGADTLDGGTGDDYLSGGAGPDLFFFWDETSNDTILDFQSGTDVIDLTSYAINEDEVKSASDGGNTVISVDSDSNGYVDFTITLIGVGAPSPGDFLFGP